MVVIFNMPSLAAASGQYTTALEKGLHGFIYKKLKSTPRHAGEGGRREQAPLLPFSWGSKSALLNAMIFFQLLI